MKITELESGHVHALGELFSRLPASDLTFIKDDLSEDAVTGWLDQPGRTWVTVADDGSVVGFGALVPLTGWSDHVADLRLVVDPATRGKGVGRDLARHALGAAIKDGRSKVLVEVPAEQERTLNMFLGLGFAGEALLRDHFRDRGGELQDLVMLAYFANQAADELSMLGVADALEGV